MHTAEKVWSGIGAAVFGLVAVSAMTPTTSATTALAASTATDTAVLSTTTVTGVIDGDTVLAGTDVIHVIGIDSCDVSTPGGAEAKRMAEAMLDGHRVTLRTEPGVDRDAAGRLLRRIDLTGGGDYGQFMVPFAHTGADTAGGASRQYLADLRDNDANGRSCG